MSTTEPQVAPPAGFTPLYGDAINIQVTRNPGNKMSFGVDVYSWSPVRIKMDDGPELGVTVVSPPGDANTPGHYSATALFTAKGDHTINAWNNTCTCEAEVFAGDIPAWDPSRYQLTAAEIRAQERAKAAKIAMTTGKLNG